MFKDFKITNNLISLKVSVNLKPYIFQQAYSPKTKNKYSL